MTRRIASRIGTALLAVWGASVLVFVFLRLAPGDPVRLMLGPLSSQEAVDRLTAEMGLDQPLPVQYWRFVSGFVAGDWGFSYSTGLPVTELMASRLPATVELTLFGCAFMLVGALLLAVVTTYRRTWLGRVVDVGNFVALSLPQFWLALLLLIVFFAQLRWFPGPEGRLSPGMLPPPAKTGLYTVDALLAGDIPVFWNALWHLVLPTIALGSYSLAFLCRVLQSGLRSTAREPYVLVAQAKGIGPRQAFLRHALPNAAPQALTASGILLGMLFSGGVLVETAFQWPGMAGLIAAGVQRQDFSVVQSFVLLSAICFVTVNLVVDLINDAIDPRVREEAE